MADPIEWERWEPIPTMTHIEQGCDKCLFDGPLLFRWGKTRQAAQRTRRLVQRSKISEGQRAKAVTEYEAARMIRSHYAVRCPSCGEEVVYLTASISTGEMTEVEELYQPPDFDSAKHARRHAPEQPALFELEPVVRLVGLGGDSDEA